MSSLKYAVYSRLLPPRAYLLFLDLERAIGGTTRETMRDASDWCEEALGMALGAVLARVEGRWCRPDLVGLLRLRFARIG